MSTLTLKKHVSDRLMTMTFNHDPLCEHCGNEYVYPKGLNIENFYLDKMKIDRSK